MTTPRTARDGADGAVRVARAVLLAAVTVGFSAGAHVMAGGAPPSATGLVLAGSVVLAATSLLGRRRLHPATLVPVLLALQSALHLGFQALARPTALAATSSGGGGAGHAGHHGQHDPVPAPELLLGDTVPAAAAHAHGHVAMLLAHVAAIVAITVLAVGADRALGRTVDRVVRLFLAPVPTVPVRAALVGPTWTDVDALSRDTVWSTPTRPRRGPPPVLGAV